MASWEYLGGLLVVLTPLVGIPLTAITFYLRALREQHTGKLSELAQRADRLDEQADTLNRRINEVERDCTTKEEWVRESMLARGERQWLTEAVVSLQAETQAADGGLAGRIDRATRATLAASERLERLCESLNETGGPPPEPLTGGTSVKAEQPERQR